MRWRYPPAICCGLLLAGTLAAADPKPEVKPASAARSEVPYRLTDTKHVLVRVKINGKGPFNLICDTGAPAVFITKAVAKKAGADIDKKGWANFEKFELEGGLAVEKARGRVEDLFQLDGMNSMGLAGVELHGVIGYNVLAKYRITYDFTSDKLGFEAIPGFEPPALVPIGSAKGGQGGLDAIGPLMKTMAALMGIKPNYATAQRGFVGIEFEEKDGIVVKSVLAGSPAEKAGFKPGDKIESVKNTSIDDTRDLNRALAKAGVGVKLKVSVKRGDKTEDLMLELGRGL
jgi:serine protease DegQ